MLGKLYLVATPIGNLEDITYRAINILKEVDIIAAEDTRHTLKLLNYYEISKPLISYHRHNEEIKSNLLINKLLEGQKYCHSYRCWHSRNIGSRRRNCKRGNKKQYRYNTNTWRMCFDKCSNSIRIKY